MASSPSWRHVVPAALAALALLVAGCPSAPPAVCGNGTVEDSEDEASCCADAGCAFGACLDGVCTDPWTVACDGVPDGICAGRYVCEGATPPAYDCAVCGCADGDACADQVCVDAITRGLERDQPALPDDLDIEEYVQLYADLRAVLDAGEGLTVAELGAEMGGIARADRRANTLVLGVAPGSNADAVAEALVAAMGLAVSKTLPAGRCDDVAAAAGEGLLPGTFVVATVPDADADAITCAYPGTWSRCALPQVSACVERTGRLPLAAVVVDLTVALKDLDRALLVRASLQTAETMDAFLAAALAAFADAASLVDTQAGLAVGDRFARVAGRFIVLADPNARPDALASFRAVWDDAPSQQFLLAHDIQPRDCTFAVSATVAVHCENAGFFLDATVDPGTHELLDSSTGP